MNLFERLKPEYKDKLEASNITYPSLVGYIVDELENHKYVRLLPYGLVVDLKFLLDVSSPYEIFEEL